MPVTGIIEDSFLLNAQWSALIKERDIHYSHHNTPSWCLYKRVDSSDHEYVPHTRLYGLVLLFFGKEDGKLKETFIISRVENSPCLTIYDDLHHVILVFTIL